MTAAELIGKTLLAGVTLLAADGTERGRFEVYGTVINADDEDIAIERADGSVYALPPDLEAVERAGKGVYTLRSTGEQVTDPDFNAAWTVTERE